ncbi:MAG: polysaccharide biosynthesis tyrosine autokinase [Alphaproteobacteria bacterium]|nr:MAG: polysaccharide biosynthesis tyrosine autokinase [Alphaproteobacteria bacterium]
MSSPDTTAAGAPATRDAAAARLVRRVLKQWPLIVLCAFVASAAGYVASSTRDKLYESTATIQLGELDLSALLIGQNVQSNPQTVEREAATNSALITLPRVRARTVLLLQGRVTDGEVAEALTVVNQPDSNLIDITARSSDPRLAAQIAGATTRAFIETRREANLERVAKAKSQVRAQVEATGGGASETTRLLSERLELVDVIGALGESVEIEQGAPVPNTPVSPNPKRDAFLALLAGGILGAAAALLRARLDDKIRDPAEFSEIWDLPLVGSVPKSKELVDEGRDLPSSEILEAFALARTNLRYLHMGGEVKSVAVTSSVAEEGKSTVTWNLALSSAIAEARVLVIEADMRRPALSERLGLPAKNGLAEVLAGMIGVQDAIVKVPFGDPARGLSGEVDVLPAGLVPPSPIALLERERLALLIEAVKDVYDLILVDTPPTTVVADTLIIARHVDGVLVVSRLGRVRRGQIERLRDQLLDTDTAVLGQLVNGSAAASSYGYGSYSTAQQSNAA